MPADSFKTLYPFASNYLDLGDLRYHYLDEGSGRAIVMLHGNPTWSFYYRNLVRTFRSSNRVIVPDHIGCGFSDKPQHYSYCLKNHIENFKKLIEKLEVNSMDLVIHDWGGPIGLGFAVQFPEKIRKIIVLNTTAFLTKKYPLRILLCKLPILGNIAIRHLNFFALGAIYMASKNRQKMTPAVKNGYLKPYDNYQNRIANLRFVEDIPLNKKHRSWNSGEEISAQLDKLKEKPILICWGDKDFCFTETFLNEWKRRFPNAEIHRFPNAGHYILEDAFDHIEPLTQQFLNN